MVNFAKDTGIVKPSGTTTSTRGGNSGSTRLFAKDPGTVKPSGGSISTKGGSK